MALFGIDSGGFGSMFITASFISSFSLSQRQLEPGKLRRCEREREDRENWLQ